MQWNGEQKSAGTGSSQPHLYRCRGQVNCWAMEHLLVLFLTVRTEESLAFIEQLKPAKVSRLRPAWKKKRLVALTGIEPVFQP